MLYNVAQAAELLGIHPQTLRNWDRSGSLVAIKTPGGQRRYSPEMLRIYQENLTSHKSSDTTTSSEIVEEW